MDYVWIIEINCFCSVILGILLYSLFKNYDRQTKQRYYIKSIVTGFVSFLSEIVWALIEGGFIQVPRTVNFLTNAVYYIFSILMGYYWLCFVEISLESRTVKIKALRLVAALPVLFVGIGVVLSYFNGFFFYIDSSNLYHRGQYVLLHTVLCHLYTVITSAHAFIKSFKTKIYHKAAEYKILSMFLIFPLVIGIIQIFVPNIPTVSVGVTLAFLFVYIDLQNLLISVDTLSGLNNRNQLMRYLSSRMRNDFENKNLYVFMLDVNFFKKVNDTYGHVEGDAALVRCAKALKIANSSGKNFIGRYGGDEFIIIADLKKEDEVEMLCLKIKNTLSKLCEEDKVPYDLSFSIGYAKYRNDMKNIQAFIAEADKKLYEAKKSIKK